MEDRFKFRVYFKGSEYAEKGYEDLNRTDVIFSLRPDGQIIRDVIYYEYQQEGCKGSPSRISFTPNNELYDIQFCTGLKDKNGKLIYEGDILRVTGSRDTSGYGVVEYLQAGCRFFVNGYLDNPSPYYPRRKGEFYHPLQEWLCTEVISNIYENPELLEEKC